MTTVTLTLEAAQQVFALISKLDITDFTPDSDAREQAIAIMQAAIEAKPAVHLAHEQKNWRQMLGDVGGWDNELVSVQAGGVRKIIEEVEMLRASYEQAPEQKLTQPDLQRLWNDAMYANRQSTTDAAMDYARAVLAASKAPEQKLEPLAGGWGVD